MYRQRLRPGPSCGRRSFAWPRGFQIDRRMDRVPFRRRAALVLLPGFLWWLKVWAPRCAVVRGSWVVRLQEMQCPNGASASSAVEPGISDSWLGQRGFFRSALTCPRLGLCAIRLDRIAYNSAGAAGLELIRDDARSDQNASCHQPAKNFMNTKGATPRQAARASSVKTRKLTSSLSATKTKH